MNYTSFFALSKKESLVIFWRIFLLRVIFCCCFEFGCLVCDRECIDDVSEISRHDCWEVGKIFIDTVIGHTILREIVGADFLTAISCSDLCEASIAEFFCFFFFFESKKTSL